MSIIRKPKTNNYSIISNEPLRDSELSWKAKGMLTYLLSLPDDWTITIRHLAKVSKDGYDSTKAGIRELKEAGYLTLTPIRDEHGKILKWEYIVNESPGTLGNQQQVDNPPVDNPPVDNPPLLNTNIDKILKKTKTRPESDSHQDKSCCCCFSDIILPDNIDANTVQKILSGYSQTYTEQELKDHLGYAISKADKSDTGRFTAFLGKSLKEGWVIPPLAPKPEAKPEAVTIPDRAKIKIGNIIYKSECGGFIKTQAGTIPPGLLQNMIKQGEAQILSQ